MLRVAVPWLTGVCEICSQSKYAWGRSPRTYTHVEMCEGLHPKNHGTADLYLYVRAMRYCQGGEVRTAVEVSDSEYFHTWQVNVHSKTPLTGGYY